MQKQFYEYICSCFTVLIDTGFALSKNWQVFECEKARFIQQTSNTVYINDLHPE